MPKDLKLINWADDGCPPIDLNEKPGLILELVAEIKRLREEREEFLSRTVEAKTLTTLLAMCSIHTNDIASEITLRALNVYAEKGGEFSIRDSSKIVCEVEEKYKPIVVEEEIKEKA